MQNTSPTAIAAALLLGASLLPADAAACTRAVYLGPNDRILTGRSMDWAEDIQTNLWVLPRGIERHGEAGPDSLRWEARYGSVVATAYDVSSTDGLNEAGLMANLLWLPDSVYPEPDGESPTLSVSLWAQFMLDRFATVAEAVDYVQNNPFLVISGDVPGQGREAALHLSLSDASGDSAIFEFIDGQLQIHHSRDYQVMTNQPTFDRQLALTAYWEEIGGTTMLPGTNRPADRFARASFYINAVPKVDDRRMAGAAVMSVMRNVSVPVGISTPDAPHISSTQWRVMADHKDRIYYFESALSPSLFWVELDDLDFSAGTEVRTLRLGAYQSRNLNGAASDLFEPAEPFAFAPAAL